MRRKLPEGAVSARYMCRKTGLGYATVQQYMASRGLPGYIPADRIAAVEEELRTIKANGLRGQNRVKLKEIADAAGCCPATVSNYLRRAGWPKNIPRWRFDEAVAFILQGQLLARENLRKSGKKHIQEALKKRWKKPSAASKTAAVPKPDAVSKPALEKSKPVLEKSQPCNWRVSILGNRGWIVVRTGTREEMEPWAALLMLNGIEARARRNEYGGVCQSVTADER